MLDDKYEGRESLEITLESARDILTESIDFKDNENLEEVEPRLDDVIDILESWKYLHLR